MMMRRLGGSARVGAGCEASFSFLFFYVFERAAFSQAVLVRASLFLPLLNLRSRSLEGKRRSAEENILLPINSRLHRSHSY